MSDPSRADPSQAAASRSDREAEPRRTPLYELHVALGARMVGGGFGGSALALCEADAVEVISRAVLVAAERRGLPQPRFWEVAPAAGAHRCDTA